MPQLKGLPQERLLSDKVLERITPQEGMSTYHLEFQDGSTFDADVAVGCDGVHSDARRFVLSPEHEAMIEPVFAGLWDAHGEITSDEAVKKFGSQLLQPDLPRAMGIVGEEACIMFNPYDDGAKYAHIDEALRSFKSRM